MSIGLLALRLALGCVLAIHATQKTLGWFAGPGITRSIQIFDRLGQTPALPTVYLASTCEAVSAALVALGLITPLGAAIGIGTMFVAAGAATMSTGSAWNTAGGGEYPFFLMLALLALAFTGPGSYSLDALITAPWYPGVRLSGAWLGLAATGAGLLAASPALARTWLTLRRRRDELAG